VNLEWMILANHAEEQGGLLFLSGATWDTVNVQGPLEGGPPETVALFQGTLVIRLLFHTTETGRDHTATITVLDADGHQLQQFEAGFRVERSEDIPPGWEQGVNILIGLSGMPLRDFGFYTFSLQVDNQHLGDRPFRVLKKY
jgi:hypothetical protein